MCNHIDVNEPVLELVRIENSAFNKTFYSYQMSSCSLYLLTEQNNFRKEHSANLCFMAGV